MPIAPRRKRTPPKTPPATGRPVLASAVPPDVAVAPDTAPDPPALPDVVVAPETPLPDVAPPEAV